MFNLVLNLMALKRDVTPLESALQSYYLIALLLQLLDEVLLPNALV